MLAEWGHLTLITAFVMTLAIIATAFDSRRADVTVRVIVRLWHLTSLCLVLSFGFLLGSFFLSDFSHALVVFHSASDTPALYRLTAAWGNHEGSLLMWCLIMSLYGSLLVRVLGKAKQTPFGHDCLIIHGVFLCLFLLLVVFFSNPFVRLMPAALEGQGLNPLLQHPALAAHPPFLYGGYVGLSAVASLAFAHLRHPSDKNHLLSFMRPLALLAWTSLTIGIFLGSWWAYHELGWGGFWFWDPVENASFIPWCAATALIHSLATKDERHSRWVTLLAIVSFGFAIIGTFLVRSGLITSVHAFASDPHRGIVLLLIFALYAISAIVLYGRGGARLPPSPMPPVGSRHFMMVAQSVILLALAASILLGTLYPLLSAQQVSVGPPYYIYNLLVLGMPLALMMGVAPHRSYGRATWLVSSGTVRHLTLAFVLSCAIAVISVWRQERDILIAFCGIFAACWIILASMGIIRTQKIKWRHALPMMLAHSGVAVVIAAATTASLWQKEAIQFQTIGETVSLNAWQFELQSVEDIWENNYISKKATIIAHDDTTAIPLMPERRLYAESRTVTTESAVASLWTHDLYVAFSEPINETANQQWTTRYWIKPFVSWLWIGGVMMALAGILALRRRRQS